jgi:carbonic anhydrase
MSSLLRIRRSAASRVAAAALLAGAAVLTAGAAATGVDTAAHHWGYTGAGGPEHWAQADPAFATCGTGRRQSPIDIRGAERKALPAIEFAYRPTPLAVTDTGHSFQVNAASDSGGISVGGEHYELVQFHFHRPSEEHLQGHAYAMVAHLVHKNGTGQLAVVAVLIHAGEENAFLKPLFDHFPARGTAQASVPGATLDLGQFLPERHGYYTFEGSLTTPPCSEQVRWFVLKTAVTASKAQIGQFAARYPMNARPVQPLNDRTVEESLD